MASKTVTRSQTCQLSRFCRESHDLLSFLTVSRQGSSISRVLGKIILKWFKLLNQNKNGKLTRNACAIKWKTNKEEHCSYFFVPSCDFRLCSINLIVFLRVCPPFWKGSRPWERGLIPRRLPCWQNWQSFLFRPWWHLSNILAMNLAYPEEMTPCYKFRPSDDLLESSKKAASSYNREHK